MPEVTDSKPILKLKRPRAQQRTATQERARPSGERRSKGAPARERAKPRAPKGQATFQKAADQEDRLLEALRRLAPETWNPEQPLPLAVGIHSQIFPIAEPQGISRSAVRRFLTRWTSRPEYLDALSREGAVRHCVDGREGEAVEQRHGRRARQRLDGPADAAAVTAADESRPAPEPPPTPESSPSRQ